MQNTIKTAAHERDEYTQQKKRWDKLDALIERHTDIKDRTDKREYLIPMPAEQEEVYQDRVKRSYLWPAVTETLAGMVGIVTSKGFSVDTIKNDQLRAEILTPLKGDGSMTKLLDRFSKIVCQFGHGFILVSPGSEVNSNKAQDLQKKRRVRWTVYAPVSLINWAVKDESESGDPRFAEYVILKKFEEEQEGDFGHDTVQVFLKISQEGTQRYEQREGESEPVPKGGIVPHQVASGEILGLLPMVAAYYTFLQPFVSKPPLNSMAQLNIAHLNASSNSDLAIRQSQFTIPVFSGVQKSHEKDLNNLVTGPTTGLKLPAGIKFDLVETTGKSLDIGLKNITEIEKKINQMSFKELMADPNISRDVTATEAGIKQQNKLSPLAAAALNIESAINEAIRIHAAYLGIDITETERFKINFDLARVVLGSDEIRVMIELLQNRVITREILFEAISNGQLINSDLTYKEVKGIIDEESLDFEDANNTSDISFTKIP